MSIPTLPRIIPKHLWILLAIILLGAFLRSYHLQNWLDFGSDQVKDFTIVSAAANGTGPWPLEGPDMSHSGTGAHNQRFLLGPIYYYFEILSVKLFGSYPDRLAYPDLLFAILSIPLFYSFLRRLFTPRLALALTGLYAISFYSLSFSHSAWNVNSIPFFVLLFLLALHTFTVEKERTHWGWVGVLGLSLGVGIQLHAILFTLLPATLLSAAAFSLRKNKAAWKKLLAAIALALLLNTSQVISEFQTNFHDSKMFYVSIAGMDSGKNHNWTDEAFKLVRDIEYHVQANEYILSAIGSDTCSFRFTNILENTPNSNWILSDSPFMVMSFVSLLFSLFGYGLLVSHFCREQNPDKKQLLGLLILYSGLSFLIFFPLRVDLLRYFVHVFFIPFLFLGFIAQYVLSRFSKRRGIGIVSILFCLIALTNIVSTWNLAAIFAAQNRTDLDIIVLGEIDSALDYLTSSNGTNHVTLFYQRDQKLFLGSLAVIAKERSVDITPIESTLSGPVIPTSIPEGQAIFFIGSSAGNPSITDIAGHPVKTHRDFGEVRIYRLN